MRATDVIRQLRSGDSKLMPAPRSSTSAIAALRRFVRPETVRERCEICAVEVSEQHQHLIEPANGRICCACEACGILFSDRGGTKYRRIPRRLRYLPEFRMDGVRWAALMVPINLVFFFDSSVAGKIIAYYPSPAGPTEALIEADSWSEIVRDNAILKDMEPDVEALLVNRLGQPGEYYLAPIDDCYKLVGLVRKNWRGLSGGSEVWAEIERFFAGLKQRATVVRSEPHV